MMYKFSVRAASLFAAAALLWMCAGCSDLGSGGAGGRDGEVDAYLGTFIPVLTLISSPSNGGTMSASPDNGGTYRYGDTVMVEAAPGAGYVFNGWSGAASGAARTIRVIMDGNKTLTANFLRTYRLDVAITPESSGAVSRSPDKESYAAGEPVVIEATPLNDGYAFDEWSDGIKLPGRTIIMNQDEELTANFKHKYTVTFDVNGGRGMLPAPETAIEGSGIKLPDGNSLEKPGSSFNGWISGSGVNYSAGATFLVTKNETLYANWGTEHTVTFNANGGSGIPPKPQTVHAGSDITLPDSGSLSRLGYVFGGWSVNSNGSAPYYGAGGMYTPTGNVTMYARWVGIYIVAFDMNGGVGTLPTARTASPGAVITLPLLNATKSGYVFYGWNTDAHGGGTSYQAGADYYVTGNSILYAEWVSPEYR